MTDRFISTDPALVQLDIVYPWLRDSSRSVELEELTTRGAARIDEYRDAPGLYSFALLPLNDGGGPGTNVSVFVNT